MKKVISVLIALVLMLGMFSGCGSNSSSDGQAATQPNDQAASTPTDSSNENKPESIQIITDADTLPIAEYTAKLYKEKYGVDVQIVSQSYDQTYTKIVASVMGGSPVDIITNDSIWTAEFANTGISVPLDDMLTPELREDIFKPFIDGVTWNGKVWGIPFQTQGKWLFYNKAMLEKAGYKNPPKTFDELFAMGKDMIDKKLAKHAIAWAATQAEGLVCDWTAILHANGSSWKTSDGKWGFNDSNGVKALDMIADSLKNGLADPASITYNDRDVLNPFMAGDIPFVLNWAFAWALSNDPKESKIAGNVGISLIPGSNGVTSASVTGGGAFGMASTTKNKEWAWKYLELMLSKEVQTNSLNTASSMPVLKSMYEDQELMENYKYMQEMYPQFQYAVPRPSLVKYTEWSKMMQTKLHEVLTGQKSSKDALNEMVSESNSKYMN